MPDVRTFLFADGTKLFRKISSKDDALTLQSDLNSLELWSKNCQIDFNSDKCHALTLEKFENIRYTHRYKIFEHNLEHVFNEKVTFDSDLKFEEHISEKVRKANAIVDFIRRSFSFLDCNLFKKLYDVRPTTSGVCPVRMGSLSKETHKHCLKCADTSKTRFSYKPV